MLRKKNKTPVAVQQTILSDQLSLLDVIVETCQDRGCHTVIAESDQTFTVMIDRGGPFSVDGGGLTGSEALVKAASLRHGTYTVIDGWPVDQPVYHLGLAEVLQGLILETRPEAVQLPPARGVDAIHKAAWETAATTTPAGDGKEPDPLTRTATNGPEPDPIGKSARKGGGLPPFERRASLDRRGRALHQPPPAAITPPVEAPRPRGILVEEPEPTPASAVDLAVAEAAEAPVEAVEAPMETIGEAPAAIPEFAAIAVTTDVEDTAKPAPRPSTKPPAAASVIAEPSVAKASSTAKIGTPIELSPKPTVAATVPAPPKPKKSTTAVAPTAPPKPKNAAASAPPTAGPKPKKGARQTRPLAAGSTTQVAQRPAAVGDNTEFKDTATYLREVARAAKIGPEDEAPAARKHRGWIKRRVLQFLLWTVEVEGEPDDYTLGQVLILVGRSLGSAFAPVVAPVSGAVRGREYRDRETVAGSFGGNLGARLAVWSGVVPGTNAWALAFAGAGAGLWTLSLRGVNPRGMSDIGLISVLPPGIYVAAALTIMGLVFSLRARRGSPALMLLQVAVLIFMLYGATALVEEQPRFSVVYRHAGFAEYIIRNRGVDPRLDAYFNWPGFFIALATVVQALHLRDALALAPWAPVFFNLLYLPPLYLLFESFTHSQRTRLLAIWFFYLGNWVSQDYLSPQALDYFFYLVIIALLLRLLSVRPAQRSISRAGSALKRLSERVSSTTFATAPATGPVPGSRPWTLVLAVVIVFAAIVCSHPLTPFFAIATTVLLVVFGVVGPRWLPALMIVMTGAWILLMAHTYLAGHLGDVIGSAGSFGPTASSNVTGRLRGSQGHQLVAYARVVMTGLLWALASLGLIRALKARQWPLPELLTAVAPLSLVLLQAYGGEMLLRAYLFSLPAVAYLAAVAVVRMRGMLHSNRGTLAVALLSALMLGSFLLTRYGNERGDYITNGELSTVQRLYSIAPRGSVLATIGGPPWKYRDFEVYDYRSLAPEDFEHQSIRSVADKLRARGGQQSYFLVTRSEAAQLELFDGRDPAWFARLEDRMIGSGIAKRIYDSPDGQILQLTQGAV
jgi:hypothetical protein